MRKGYYTISHELTDSEEFKGLSFEAKTLLLWLHKWSNRYGHKSNGWFGRSGEKLAKDLGICRNTVIKAKEELRAAKLLEEESGKSGRKSNRYRLP